MIIYIYTVIRDLTFTLSQMSALIEQSAGLPVIRMDSMAGQYAKPRSQAFENTKWLNFTQLSRRNY